MKETPFNSVLQLIWFYISTVKKIFTKEFITERWYLHLLVSFLIGLPVIRFMLKNMHLATTPFLFQLFIGGLLFLIVNALREGFYSTEHEAPFDSVDVIMGSYGGILSALVLSFLN